MHGFPVFPRDYMESRAHSNTRHTREAGLGFLSVLCFQKRARGRGRGGGGKASHHHHHHHHQPSSLPLVSHSLLTQTVDHFLAVVLGKMSHVPNGSSSQQPPNGVDPRSSEHAVADVDEDVDMNNDDSGDIPIRRPSSSANAPKRELGLS